MNFWREMDSTWPTEHGTGGRWNFGFKLWRTGGEVAFGKYLWRWRYR